MSLPRPNPAARMTMSHPLRAAQAPRGRALTHRIPALHAALVSPTSVLTACAQKKNCRLGVVAHDEHQVMRQWWQIRRVALAKAAGVVADIWDRARKLNPTTAAPRPLVVVMSGTMTTEDMAAVPALHGMIEPENIRSSVVRHHVNLKLVRLSASGKPARQHVANLVGTLNDGAPGILVCAPTATGVNAMTSFLQVLFESSAHPGLSANDVIAVTGQKDRAGTATLLQQSAARKFKVMGTTEVLAPLAQGVNVPATDLVLCGFPNGHELSKQLEGRIGRGPLRDTRSTVHVLLTPAACEVALHAALSAESTTRHALAAAEKGGAADRIANARADLVTAERGVASVGAELRRHLFGGDVCADHVWRSALQRALPCLPTSAGRRGRRRGEDPH